MKVHFGSSFDPLSDVPTVGEQKIIEALAQGRIRYGRAQLDEMVKENPSRAMFACSIALAANLASARTYLYNALDYNASLHPPVPDEANIRSDQEHLRGMDEDSISSRWAHQTASSAEVLPDYKGGKLRLSRRRHYREYERLDH